jgi:hypothetical protein
LGDQKRADAHPGNLKPDPPPILPMNCGKPHASKGMKGTKPSAKGTKKGK